MKPIVALFLLIATFSNCQNDNTTATEAQLIGNWNEIKYILAATMEEQKLLKVLKNQ